VEIAEATRPALNSSFAFSKYDSGSTVEGNVADGGGGEMVPVVFGIVGTVDGGGVTGGWSGAEGGFAGFTGAADGDDGVVGGVTGG
jgi:hypothetical protein